MHDECWATAQRCLGWARAHLRMGQPSATLDRGVAFAIVGRELLRCCETLDALAMGGGDHAGGAAFIAACERGGRLLEEAGERLREVGVTP